MPDAPFGFAPDPFETAAYRQRQGVRPMGGRQETTPGEFDPLTQTASDFLIPKSPMDVAMMAMGGPFGRLAKAAMLAGGTALSSSEAEAGPLALVRKAIRAYHGSPHDFDRFDLSRIGTGEGAQAYGHGLYFAENPATAQSYRDSLSPNKQWTVNNKVVGEYGSANTPDARAAAYLRRATGEDRKVTFDDIESAAKAMRETNRTSPGLWSKQMLDDTYRAMMGMEGKTVAEKVRGRMYEVNINAHPDEFLDWDKPLSQSGAAPVIAPIVDKMRGASGMIERKLGVDPNGEQIYSTLGSPFGRKAVTGQSTGFSDKAGSTEVLREAGIPGIRYLDQGSRVNPPRRLSTGQWQIDTGGTPPRFPTKEEATKAYDDMLAKSPGTSNYVVFDDKLIDILRKYGLMGGAAVPPALAAANQTQPQPFGSFAP